VNSLKWLWSRRSTRSVFWTLNAIGGAWAMHTVRSDVWLYTFFAWLTIAAAFQAGQNGEACDCDERLADQERPR
jgi:hypothetical protein